MTNFISNIFAKFLGSSNARTIKRYTKVVNQINHYEKEFEPKTHRELLELSESLSQQIKSKQKTIDDVLPLAFALIREASKRTLELRPFDVQMMGAIALHEGNISEMRTGEGKTLVATMPAYLNALNGNSVHVITVNDYLAVRDSEWMSPIYSFLGLKTSVVKAGMSLEDKVQAYQADIIYGTNNEFGFDYLRDNLVQRKEDQVQGKLSFAIIDEVDSILIDEARTPLIISGRSSIQVSIYEQINKIARALAIYDPPEGKQDEDIQASRVAIENSGELVSLEEALETAKSKNAHLVEVGKLKGNLAVQIVPSGDFTIDEKSKQAYLTDEGHSKVEVVFRSHGLIKQEESLYDYQNIKLIHYLTASLRAQYLFKKEVDYIVQDGEIVIVDEFTGRAMPGRRWSDGLHQAIEAKESVNIKEESQTVASITFQNFFRMYEKLSGMTGTADTEAFEFQQIYGLEVIVIPTHRDMIRKDYPDLMYLTHHGKYEAIIQDIEGCVERGQPVLVGTTSIENSELLSSILSQRKIKHNVLNAKQHEREATIISEAGRKSAVTIATNMAGRGTDIVLGGKLIEGANKSEWQAMHDKVLKAGGLHIIGTERHESRRIDNQLRGRSGRQGDLGSSRFYLSLEDNLMRIFGDPIRTKRLLSGAGMKEDEAIESKMLTRQIERAQRKVESHNFDIRKQLLDFDDVANEQRRVIYQQRNDILNFDAISNIIVGIREEVITDAVAQYISEDIIEEDWDLVGLQQNLQHDFLIDADIETIVSKDKNVLEISSDVVELAEMSYIRKCALVSKEMLEALERSILLQQMDLHWREHLSSLDALRQGIHLRGYAQKNPKQEYKREAFAMFSEMLESFKKNTIIILAKVQFKQAAAEAKPAVIGTQNQELSLSKPAVSTFNQRVISNRNQAGQRPLRARPETYKRDGAKIGRNDPCPCGSGKKFKQCHGKI